MEIFLVEFHDYKLYVDMLAWREYFPFFGMRFVEYFWGRSTARRATSLAERGARGRLWSGAMQLARVAHRTQALFPSSHAHEPATGGTEAREHARANLHFPLFRFYVWISESHFRGWQGLQFFPGSHIELDPLTSITTAIRIDRIIQLSKRSYAKKDGQILRKAFGPTF